METETNIRQFSTSSSIKVQGHAQLVASLIEGLPLNEGGQGQLNAITEILTVAKTNLAAIAHLCLEGKEYEMADESHRAHTWHNIIATCITILSSYPEPAKVNSPNLVKLFDYGQYGI